MHTDLGGPEDGDTLSELHWLLSQLRVEAEPLSLGASRPLYSPGRLAQSIDEAVTAYLRYWELRLGVAVDPAIRPAHWSKVKALCVRYARRSNDEYEAMRPAGDLIAALTDALRGLAGTPNGWTSGQPEEDTEQQIYDALTRKVNADLRRIVNDRLFLDAAELWSEARDVTGSNSAQKRAAMVYHKILEPLVGSDGVPLSGHANFSDAVMQIVDERAKEMGVQF